jgi:hypothetical protein
VDISITGITSNRRFTKTCVRLSQPLERLRNCCSGIRSSRETFDILQLVFTDEPEDFIRKEGTRGGDRLYQVFVGMPMDGAFGPGDDQQFLRSVGNQVLRAIDQSPLGPPARRKASVTVGRWLDSVAARSPAQAS